MSRGPARPRPWLLLPAVVGAVVLVGCAGGSGSPDAQPARPAGWAPRETVGISNRTIVSAFKLDGTVELRPRSMVVAPASGTLRLRDLRDLDGADVTAGQRLATVEMPCEPPDAPASDLSASEASTPGSLVGAANTPAPPCPARIVPVDAPATGRLALSGAFERAVARGDVAAEIADGDELASVSPAGWQLRLPLGDEDQPARMASVPSLAYALLPNTTEAVFRARFDRLDYGDDGSMSVIASPVDPPDLIRGSKVTVSFVTDRREHVSALPLSAVRTTANVGQVLLLVDPKTGTTKTKAVIVGPNDGSWIEVEGLTEGDRVVRYPLDGELGDP